MKLAFVSCAASNCGSIILYNNNATRANSPDDFLEIQVSAYYDDNVDTLSFSLPSTTSYTSCLELYQVGYRSNGLHIIYPTSLTDGLHVYCDMETDGGGWIVFQRRQDGSVDFYRTWSEYQSGFGDLHNEFWLGNNILRDLTGSGQWELRVDMEDWQSNTSWAYYGEFAVTWDNYTLHVGSYNAQSTAGDALTWHDGQPFTTKDQDNDRDSTDNCAVDFEGAWWFRLCIISHLNGKYYSQLDPRSFQGIRWLGITGSEPILKKCNMKIRQVM
ncbi:fibrinogen C domain-containing protein 1-like [Asterias amurensis]|uniref:fibrinogen C domain-containing protein 1-like n=1 Tax=Asterias amurensis TaxID=7602 RepID=UPI003AB2729A